MLCVVRPAQIRGLVVVLGGRHCHDCVRTVHIRWKSVKVRIHNCISTTISQNYFCNKILGQPSGEDDDTGADGVKGLPANAFSMGSWGHNHPPQRAYALVLPLFLVVTDHPNK